MIIYRDYSDGWGNWIPDGVKYKLIQVEDITSCGHANKHYGFRIHTIATAEAYPEHILTADTEQDLRWHVDGRTFFIRNKKELMEFKTFLESIMLEEIL